MNQGHTEVDFIELNLKVKGSLPVEGAFQNTFCSATIVMYSCTMTGILHNTHASLTCILTGLRGVLNVNWLVSFIIASSFFSKSSLYTPTRIHLEGGTTLNLPN